MLVVLLTVLIASQVSFAIPFSYVATPMFGAYQATFKLTPLAPITSSTGSFNPYTINFKEARTGLTPANTFLSLASFEKADASPDCSFRISVAAAIPTQVLVTLTVIGSSAFQSLSFFVIVTSTTHSTYVDVQFFQITSPLFSSTNSGGRTVSGLIPYTTSVTPSFRYVPFLSYFTLSNSDPSKKFQVGIEIPSAPPAQIISFNYYVDQNTDLTQIGMVLLVYRDSGNYPTTYQLYPSNQAGYITNINSVGINGFVDGFEDKCIVGHKRLVFGFNFQLSFSISTPPPATTYSSNNASLTVNLLCLIMSFNCSTIDINCQICISYTACSQCKATYFPYVFTNLSSKCQSCAVAITGCLTCSSATACTTCISPTYLSDVGSVCSPCSKFITNCLNCSVCSTSTCPNNTNCTGCLSSYGLDQSLVCRLCYTMMTGCQTCINHNTCTRCLNGFYIDSNGNCQICSTVINNCAICDNSTYCTVCNSDSYLNPSHSGCICNAGLYSISMLCSVAGCSSAYRFNSTTVCLACNTTAKFILSNGNCNCMEGYVVNGNVCNLVCGDGKVISEPCDDGNLINGDGCNSNCQVQTNFNCLNGSLNTSSVCVYVGPISVSLNNIVKAPSKNQATLTFAVSPATLNLNTMDFEQYTTLAIGSQVIKCNSILQAASPTAICSYNLNNLTSTLTFVCSTAASSTAASPMCSSSYDQAGTLTLICSAAAIPTAMCSRSYDPAGTLTLVCSTAAYSPAVIPITMCSSSYDKAGILTLVCSTAAQSQATSLMTMCSSSIDPAGTLTLVCSPAASPKTLCSSYNQAGTLTLVCSPAAFSLAASPITSCRSSIDQAGTLTLVCSTAAHSPAAPMTMCSSSYDKAGSLTLVVDYTADLQGSPASMILSYDSTKVQLPANNVKAFNIVGSNLPVLVANISGKQQIVYTMGLALAALYGLVLVLSTIFHKMIGVQTMQILQNVFFVRYLLDNSSPYVFFNINSVKYINGYNVFSQYTNFRLLDSTLIRMGLGKNFVFNVMAQAGIILLMWVVSGLCARKVRNLKLTRAEMTSQGMQILKRAQLLQSKFSNAAFIFTVYSFYLVMFSALSSVQDTDELSFPLPRILLVFTILAMFYSIVYIACQIYSSWKPKFDEDEGLNFKYVSVFLIYHVLMSLLMAGLPQASFGKFIIAACQLIYIVFLIYAKPYFLKVQNVLLIISQFAGFGFTVWIIISDFVSMDNLLLHQVMLGYEGLLSVVGVMAIIRLFKHFKDNEKAFKLMHQEQEKAKGKDSFSKTQFKKQQDILKVQKIKPTLSQKKKIEENQEVQELQRIKNRLKGEHKVKLMEESVL